MAAVARVGAMLATGLPADRTAALDSISSWRTIDDDPGTVSAILAAAARSGPVDHADPTDPAVRLVEVLWSAAHLVDLAEVEAVYLVARDPVRRALLDLLARRRDPAGLAVLRSVVGEHGWTDHLPLPTPGLLSAVLGHPQAAEFAGDLGRLLVRPGWESHAGALLARLAREVELPAAVLAGLLDLIEPLLIEAIGQCDEAFGCRNGGEASPWVWRTRNRVRLVLDVLESFDAVPGPGGPTGGGERVVDLLVRTLGSADPVVGAWGVAALAVRGVEVPWDRVWMTSHEPVPRSVLLERLDRVGLLGPVLDGSGRHRDGVWRAEADLVSWLARPGELGCVPAEVEHVATRITEVSADHAGFHLFRFRTRAPHWASARGWMVGAAGLYREDGTVPDGVVRVAVSQYDCEDTASVEEHFDAMAAAVDER